MKWITELSRLVNVNPEWLEEGVGPKNLSQNNYYDIFQQIPKVKAMLSAGGGSLTETGGYCTNRPISKDSIGWCYLCRRSCRYNSYKKD
jgi:hypothetical protein